MSLTVFRGARRAAAALSLSAVLSASAAFAQAPTLAVSQNNVVPGASVNLTITGAPGDNYAVIGSTVDAGATYAGQPLAVGADYVIVAQGVLDGTGRAVTQFTPGFRGSVIDRAYLQVATSPALDFVPLAVSAGH